ncbi:MAG: NYN domain-containing protein [Planctomycetota bacterium]
MTHSGETGNMALFCDFENVALGVRDAHYAQFDIKKVLEKLLLKGNIVVKKAYCDWERYKEFRPGMHGAAFELIEIPHVSMSGKNSADIRMVVDALDLCYTKGHVDTFVIISGDSDFSPLVSKLRENNKQVIGVGVKNSSSDLLIANCDEFIYYDDLVRRKQVRSTGDRKPAVRVRAVKAPAAGDKAVKAKTVKAPAAADKPVKAKTVKALPPSDDKKREAWDLIVKTYEALLEERGVGEKIWGSMIKQTLKRRQPGFAESYYGFRSFNQLLEEAAAYGILELERDEKSGGFIVKGCQPSVDGNKPVDEPILPEAQ